LVRIRGCGNNTFDAVNNPCDPNIKTLTILNNNDFNASIILIMKAKQIFKAVLLITITSVAFGCEKNGSACRNCTARYGGNTVGEKKACSAQEEQDFKTEYYYAEVSCR
jgi:hypothetical protein